MHGRPIGGTPAIAERVKALGNHWHGDGTVSSEVIDAIDQHAARYGPIAHSVETGTGRTTLVLSHHSSNHLVFALDDGDTLARVQGSPLLNRATTRFVPGPTQATILGHEFRDPIDLAFIDGPHAFPFPQLEYWAIYPHIRLGGLLIVDDIHLPTLGDMLDVLRVDPMWDLIAIVDNTGFLRRTRMPAIDPYGDGFWDQPYNRRIRYRHLPPRKRLAVMAKNAVPKPWKAAIRRRWPEPRIP